MNGIHLAMLIVFLCWPLWVSASVSGEQMRDEVIEMVTDNNWSGETCRRVQELGKNMVSGAQCLQRVDLANSRCLELARTEVPVILEEEQAKLLVGILMTCPMAQVLNIGYKINGGKIHVQWSAIGR